MAYSNTYPMQNPQASWSSQPWGMPQYDNRVANVGSLVANVGMQQPTSNKVSYLKSLPVTSVEEARAAMIDLDGSMYVFVNVGCGEIYTKQYNLSTGSSDFQVYTKAIPVPKDSPYVSKESLQVLEETFNSKLNKLSEELKEMKFDGKSNSINATSANSKK